MPEEKKERIKNFKWDRPTVKQRKFVCPKCGNFRMLNKGVSLSLCHDCDYINMVPESELKKCMENRADKKGCDRDWFSGGDVKK